MRLSYTNVKTFKECPKKYEFKYIQHLPEPEGIELKVGIAGHEVLEAYYSVDSIGRNQAHIDGLIKMFEDEQVRVILKESLVGYHEWASKEDKNISITSTERKIDLQIDDYKFTGKIDAEGTINDKPVLLEHKFKSQWGTDVEEQFQIDEQNKGYALATGVRQIIYNLIRTKPAKTRPKFERVHILVPESEIIRFKEDLGMWNGKIEDAKRTLQFPRNRGYGCKYCPFKEPCGI